MREEPPHRVFVERAEVGRVQLLVVRNEEFLRDGAPEACIEHALEAVVRLLLARRDCEVEVVEAVDEVLLRELVDVLLEREVDGVAFEVDERLAVDLPDVLPRHVVAEPRLDLGVLEVEEVPGVVPDEPLLLHGLAVTADLRVAFENEVIVVAALGERRGRREAGNACSHDESLHLLHRGEP